MFGLWNPESWAFVSVISAQGFQNTLTNEKRNPNGQADKESGIQNLESGNQSKESRIKDCFCIILHEAK